MCAGRHISPGNAGLLTELFWYVCSALSLRLCAGRLSTNCRTRHTAGFFSLLPTSHPASIPNPTAGRWQKPAGLPLKVKMLVTQFCPTLCDLMDCSVLGILQARILEWVAISFSRGCSQPRSPTLQADSLLSEPPDKPMCMCKEFVHGLPSTNPVCGG